MTSGEASSAFDPFTMGLALTFGVFGLFKSLAFDVHWRFTTAYDVHWRFSSTWSLATSTMSTAI